MARDLGIDLMAGVNDCYSHGHILKEKLLNSSSPTFQKEKLKEGNTQRHLTNTVLHLRGDGTDIHIYVDAIPGHFRESVWDDEKGFKIGHRRCDALV